MLLLKRFWLIPFIFFLFIIISILIPVFGSNQFIVLDLNSNPQLVDIYTTEKNITEDNFNPRIQTIRFLDWTGQIYIVVNSIEEYNLTYHIFYKGKHFTLECLVGDGKYIELKNQIGDLASPVFVVTLWQYYFMLTDYLI